MSCRDFVKGRAAGGAGLYVSQVLGTGSKAWAAEPADIGQCKSVKVGALTAGAAVYNRVKMKNSPYVKSHSKMQRRISKIGNPGSAVFKGGGTGVSQDEEGYGLFRRRIMPT